jgi:hypothetical protein
MLDPFGLGQLRRPGSVLTSERRSWPRDASSQTWCEMESIHVCRSGGKPSPAQLLEPEEGSVYGIMAHLNPLLTGSSSLAAATRRPPETVGAQCEGGGMKMMLWSALRGAREVLAWKVEGLGEYDLRRPMTPTGTNLLGLVKHLGSQEYGKFGDVFGRPAPEQLACFADGSIQDYGDM